MRLGQALNEAVADLNVAVAANLGVPLRRTPQCPETILCCRVKRPTRMVQVISYDTITGGHLERVGYNNVER